MEHHSWVQPVSRAAECPARLRVLTTVYAALVIEGGLLPLTHCMGSCLAGDVAVPGVECTSTRRGVYLFKRLLHD